MRPHKTFTVDLLTSLKTEFPPLPAGLSDEYIERNPDPITAEPENEWLVLMPAYMTWCVRSPRRNELLVVDHTIDALANFGRFKLPAPAHLNFRALCSPPQRAVVVAFLAWCKSGEVLVHEDQVERSLRRWQEA